MSTYAELEAVLGRADALAVVMTQTGSLPEEAEKFTFADWQEIVAGNPDDSLKESVVRTMRRQAKTFAEKLVVHRLESTVQTARQVYEAAGNNLDSLVVAYGLPEQDAEAKQEIVFIISELDLPFYTWLTACEQLGSDDLLYQLMIWKMSRKLENFEQRCALFGLVPKDSRIGRHLIGEIYRGADSPEHSLEAYELIPQTKEYDGWLKILGLKIARDVSVGGVGVACQLCKLPVGLIEGCEDLLQAIKNLARVPANAAKILEALPPDSPIRPKIIAVIGRPAKST